MRLTLRPFSVLAFAILSIAAGCNGSDANSAISIASRSTGPLTSALPEPVPQDSPGVYGSGKVVVTRRHPTPSASVGPYYAYVFQYPSTVVAIDESADQVAASIPVSFLDFVQLDPTHNQAFILAANNQIDVINTVSNVITSSFFVPGNTVKSFASSLDGSIGYALQIPNQLTKIDLPVGNVVGSLEVGNGLERAAFSTDPTKPYAMYADWGGNAGVLGSINGQSNTLSGKIPVGPDLHLVKMSPNGKLAYVENGTRLVHSPETLYVINLARKRTSASIGLLQQSGPFAVSRDGRYAYVTSDYSQYNGEGSLQLLDLVTNKYVSSIVIPYACGPAGGGIAFSHDGTQAFLPCGPRVLVISTASFSITNVITLSGSAWSFGDWAE